MRIEALCIILTLAGCARSPAEAETDQAASKLRVVVVKPERRDMVRRVDLPGDLEGLERVPLASRATGYVREMHVDVGDPIRKGDVLVVVDAPDLLARRDRAKAALAEAKTALERAKADRHLRDLTLERKRNLAREHGATAQEVDEADAAATLARADEEAAAARIETAAAALAELEAEVSFTELRAPFDGAVVERRVDPGALVTPAMVAGNPPLLALVRTDVVRVWIDVPEPDSHFVSVGHAVSVTAAFAPELHFPKAAVSRFAGALDPATRTLRTAIDLENPDRALRPGTYVSVRIELETRKGVPTLPIDALIQQKGKSYVFVVESGKAHRRRIETGAEDGFRVEVVSGIAPDAVVIVGGKSAASENAEVEPVEGAP